MLATSRGPSRPARLPKRRSPQGPPSSSDQERVGALGREELALAVETPSVAAQRTVRADHPMARHENRDRVGSVGGTDRSDCVRLTDRSCDVGVAAGLPDRNPAKLAPHGFLETGAANIDRKLWS